MAAPVLDARATEQLNLAVLKRVDPETEQVICQAAPSIQPNLTVLCTVYLTGQHRLWVPSKAASYTKLWRGAACQGYMMLSKTCRNVRGSGNAGHVGQCQRLGMLCGAACQVCTVFTLLAVLCMQVLATAGHVALYDFDREVHSWVSMCASKSAQLSLHVSCNTIARIELHTGTL